MSKVADDLKMLADECDSRLLHCAIAASDSSSCKGKNCRQCTVNWFIDLADRIEAEQQELFDINDCCAVSPRKFISAIGTTVDKPLKDDETIREWLDRYYIARPCFEDGDPAVCPCEIDWNGETKTMTGYRIVNSGTYELCLGANTVHMHFNDKLKRPQPKVLDADGVEIKVGDTVWLGSDELIVESISDGRVDAKFPNDTTSRLAGIANIDPCHLTHREPDSIEKQLERLNEWCDAHSYSNAEGDEFIRSVRDHIDALLKKDQS